MEIKDFVLYSLGESWSYVTRAVEGLTPDELTYTPGPECNSIVFTFWHVIRAEDMWINRIFLEANEIYESGGWREKLGTPPEDSGYNYTIEQLRDWSVPDLDILNGYADAVRKKTLDFVQSLTPEKLDEEMDFTGRPFPVGVYLAHVITEIAMNVGQICYLRGVLRGIESPPSPGEPE